MRKTLILFLSMLLAVAVFAGCATDSNGQPETWAAQETGDALSEGAGGEAAEKESSPYAFELTDIDGNVHRLSDYAGKPVYLKVWGSWCAPCVESLPHLDELAAEAEDFTVLSVCRRSQAKRTAMR